MAKSKIFFRHFLKTKTSESYALSNINGGINTNSKVCEFN